MTSSVYVLVVLMDSLLLVVLSNGGCRTWKRWDGNNGGSRSWQRDGSDLAESPNRPLDLIDESIRVGEQESEKRWDGNNGGHHSRKRRGSSNKGEGDVLEGGQPLKRALYTKEENKGDFVGRGVRL